jgi:hypothetical protein
MRVMTLVAPAKDAPPVIASPQAWHVTFVLWTVLVIVLGLLLGAVAMRWQRRRKPAGAERAYAHVPETSDRRTPWLHEVVAQAPAAAPPTADLHPREDEAWPRQH